MAPLAAPAVVLVPTRLSSPLSFAACATILSRIFIIKITIRFLPTYHSRGEEIRRRRQHIELEQRRRTELRDGYRRLKNVLPVSNPKSGRAGYEFPECKPSVAPSDLDTRIHLHHGGRPKASTLHVGWVDAKALSMTRTSVANTRR